MDQHEILPFPKNRRLVTDIGWMAQRKHVIRGFLEADVTMPRQLIREHRDKTGERLSFTAYLTACTGRAVGDNKILHAYRDWRGRLVVFEDVDIATMVEIVKDGEKIPVGHIVRGANKKTFREIHDEIRAIQEKPMKDESTRRLSSLTSIPAVFRRVLFWFLERNPQMIKRYKGTVVLTAVGMFGKRAGWGLALPSHTLGITIGGIQEKPVYVDERIERREVLSITLDFDHDIVDGAPAARFAHQFVELVESGDLLLETNSD